MIERASIGPETPRVAATLLHLAQCHHKLEYLSVSEREAREALRILEKAADSEETALLPALEILSVVEAARGRRRQAEKYYHRSLSIAEHQFGADDARVADLKSRHARWTHRKVVSKD